MVQEVIDNGKQISATQLPRVTHVGKSDSSSEADITFAGNYDPMINKLVNSIKNIAPAVTCVTRESLFYYRMLSCRQTKDKFFLGLDAVGISNP